MANETGIGHRRTAGHLGLAECCVWESLLTVWLASQSPTWLWPLPIEGDRPVRLSADCGDFSLESGCLDVSTHWMQGVEQSKLEYQDSSLVWSSILTQYSKIQRKFNYCEVMIIFSERSLKGVIWRKIFQIKLILCLSVATMKVSGYCNIF